MYYVGVVKLVQHLYESSVPIALATSGCIESHGIKTERHKELFNLFIHLVSGSSDDAVKHGKPAPDIFLICAERFKDKPSPSKVIAETYKEIISYFITTIMFILS